MRTFTAEELRRVLYCCAEELRARTAGKPPGVRPWLSELVRRLELEVAVSSSQQSEQARLTDLTDDDECIGTRTAAAILGWPMWTVQRRVADLEGHKVAGKWLFRESVVRDYAEGLTNGRRAS